MDPVTIQETTRRNRLILWTIIALLIFLVGLFLSSCTLMGARMMDPDDVAETVKLLEATGASGCTWLRGRGNPPAAQIELDMIYSFGGNNYIQCVETIRGIHGD